MSGGRRALEAEVTGTQGYGPGDAFIAPRAAHTARNLSGSEDLSVVATFVVRGTVPTVFEPAETQAALDAKCALD